MSTSKIDPKPKNQKLTPITAIGIDNENNKGRPTQTLNEINWDRMFQFNIYNEGVLNINTYMNSYCYEHIKECDYGGAIFVMYEYWEDNDPRDHEIYVLSKGLPEKFKIGVLNAFRNKPLLSYISYTSQCELKINKRPTYEDICWLDDYYNKDELPYVFFFVNLER